ncbi:hypothetical protein KW798_02480 [Candidatus Parcubacteria bacterium]|nr:hypothetical protein [Candidatus Parcubacteria bacterium]
MRMARAHGHKQVVVRGTVVKATPTQSPTGIFRWFKRGTLANIRIEIDSTIHERLQSLLRGSRESRGVEQVIDIGWGLEDPIPNEKDRVWITFSYASELEMFFEGAPSVSLKNVEVIKNERETKPDELVNDEPCLPVG